MTKFAAVHAERFGNAQVIELRPNVVQFGPAARCQISDCRDRATISVMATGDQVPPGMGAERSSCAWHVDDSLYLIGLVSEGTVTVRRLR